MSIRLFAGAAALAALLVGCASSTPFSYAENRCTGQHNQCQSDCTGVGDGPARAACMERCFAVEDRCLASGYDGSGSSLAIDLGVGAARNRSEKEADFEEWRRQRNRERAESGESDVEIEVIEQPQEQQD